MAILVFFLGHWFLSLFVQTFYLHRYAAHQMFRMSGFWVKFFYVATYVMQGSSFLNPRAYAIMHRMHHAYSDTEKDPHSPHYFKSMFRMMWKTKDYYLDLLLRRVEPEKGFDKNIPEWPAFDRFANLWTLRFVWAGLYTLYYIEFATQPWMFLLLPVHFLMGPIHGGIVNWFGHTYGYRNFEDTGDQSRNSLVVDFLTMGELFQNNHHKLPSRPNFAVRKFEIDPAYLLLKLFGWLRIIRFTRESM
jgi:stearoyl-CoA desaturase (delta-9 desaturase)